MGQDSLSHIPLSNGTRWQGRSLPYVRPYCAQRSGPKIPAGACRRLFYCSEQPDSVVSRPRMPSDGPKSLNMGLVSPLIACRGRTPIPRPTPANCQATIANRHQLPIDNHQPPTANHQPPTAMNCQPTTRPDGPKNVQK